ncbi:MAG: hypothetical protein S0880_05350 [Actinomycetota bacterium]|nr:hypothetical protein [Actinomycetota bacterium]
MSRRADGGHASGDNRHLGWLGFLGLMGFSGFQNPLGFLFFGFLLFFWHWRPRRPATGSS